MNTGIFIALRVSMLFLLAFMWRFVPHRYGKLKSLLILACSFAITTYLDLLPAKNVGNSFSMYSNISFLFELLVVSVTVYLFGAHRDDRAVLAVISAGTFDLSGVAVESVVFFSTKSDIISIGAETVFLLAALYVMAWDNKRMSLSGMLENLKGRWKLCLITAFNFLSIYAAAVWPGSAIYSAESRVLTVIMVTLTLAYYSLILSLLRAQMKSIKLEKDKEMLETYSRCLEKQAEKERKNQEKLSILRHDMRHRESMIIYYLDAGNTDQIREMLSRTGARLSDTAEIRYSRNPVLNMILSDAAQRAADNNTKFECRCEVDRLPEYIRTELATIVLNLLENALKAAAAVPEKEKRFVSFKTIPVKSQAEIEISNSYTGELKLDRDSGLPISNTQNDHGYGLRSVLTFSEKYGAPFDCETDGGIFRFRMLVSNGDDK